MAAEHRARRCHPDRATGTIEENGTYTYAVTAAIATGAIATETFTYTVTDSFGRSSTATLTFQLTVSDGTLDSLPATVTITVDDIRPVAHAGADQRLVTVRQTVQLNGSGSSRSEERRVRNECHISCRSPCSPYH